MQMWSHPILCSRHIANFLMVHIRKVDIHHPLGQDPRGRDYMRLVSLDTAQQLLKVRLMTCRHAHVACVNRFQHIVLCQTINFLLVKIPQFENVFQHAAQRQWIDNSTEQLRAQMYTGIERRFAWVIFLLEGCIEIVVVKARISRATATIRKVRRHFTNYRYFEANVLVRIRSSIFQLHLSPIHGFTDFQELQNGKEFNSLGHVRDFINRQIHSWHTDCRTDGSSTSGAVSKTLCSRGPSLNDFINHSVSLRKFDSANMNGNMVGCCTIYSWFIVPCGIHNFNGFFSARKKKNPLLQTNVNRIDKTIVRMGCSATVNPTLKTYQKTHTWNYS